MLIQLQLFALDQGLGWIQVKILFGLYLEIAAKQFCPETTCERPLLSGLQQLLRPVDHSSINKGEIFASLIARHDLEAQVGVVANARDTSQINRETDFGIYVG